MAITPLPSAPQISDDPVTFNTKANAFVGALPTMVTEINAELPAIDAAGDASDAALAAANFKGEWSTLTGALNIPASVSHNGQVWVLKNNLADVTLSEPGTGSPGDWIGVSLPAPGAEGNYLKSDGTNWVSEAFPASGDKTWTAFTASGTYTVPAGVTSIRAYAFGGGGNGAGSNTTTQGCGGGGGGCAYGDIAVTPGSTVTITIASKIATLTYGGTSLLVANPGANATVSAPGTGGTATKDASVTNGGAYTGGSGANNGGGGGSSASPLGNGKNGGTFGGGGGGWGGGGGAYGGGGGGVGGNGALGGGGSGGAATSVRGGGSRSVVTPFSDPLLSECLSPGGSGLRFGLNPNGAYGGVGDSAGPGGGGGGGYGGGGTYTSDFYYAGHGGFGGGGGGLRIGGNKQGYCGNGGFGGGGGGFNGTSVATTAVAGDGGLGGGGGATRTASGVSNGVGGGACVLIYA